MKKTSMFILGFILLAVGLGMVMKYWAALAAIVKACAGVILALVGMVLMFVSGSRR